MPFISGNQNTDCKFINAHLNVDKDGDFPQMLCIEAYMLQGQICKYFGGGNTAFLTSKLKLSMTVDSVLSTLNGPSLVLYSPLPPSSF